MIRTLIFLCLVQFGLQGHEIIYLISPPRSLSVALTRMFQERGDFEIYLEPTMPLSTSHLKPELMLQPLKDPASLKSISEQTQVSIERLMEIGAYIESKLGHLTPTIETGHEKNPDEDLFQSLKQKIYKNAEEKHVFVKEICWSANQFIQGDLEFVKNPRVHFVFLIRPPYQNIISFYKKSGAANFNMTSLIGYEVDLELYEFLKENATNKPIILLSEDLYENTEETISSLCNYVKIPFLKQALMWQDLGEEFNGVTEWNMWRSLKDSQMWHGEAIRSTSFKKPSSYELDEYGEPTFSEVKDDHERKWCRQAYLDNLPFYNKLYEEKSPADCSAGDAD